MVSSYGYDSINRNVWVSYSDGVTPGVERHYDALANGKGRLYYHVNYTNNPATGTAGYSRLVIGGYDALGRVTSQTQGFPANDGATAGANGNSFKNNSDGNGNALRAAERSHQFVFPVFRAPATSSRSGNYDKITAPAGRAVPAKFNSHSNNSINNLL